MSSFSFQSFVSWSLKHQTPKVCSARQLSLQLLPYEILLRLHATSTICCRSHHILVFDQSSKEKHLESRLLWSTGLAEHLFSAVDSRPDFAFSCRRQSRMADKYSENYKCMMCNWGSNCTRGAACTFAHSAEELKNGRDARAARDQGTGRGRGRGRGLPNAPMGAPLPPPQPPQAPQQPLQPPILPPVARHVYRTPQAPVLAPIPAPSTSIQQQGRGRGRGRGQQIPGASGGVTHQPPGATHQPPASQSGNQSFFQQFFPTETGNGQLHPPNPPSGAPPANRQNAPGRVCLIL